MHNACESSGYFLRVHMTQPFLCYPLLPMTVRVKLKGIQSAAFHYTIRQKNCCVLLVQLFFYFWLFQVKYCGRCNSGFLFHWKIMPWYLEPFGKIQPLIKSLKGVWVFFLVLFFVFCFVFCVFCCLFFFLRTWKFKGYLFQNWHERIVVSHQIFEKQILCSERGKVISNIKS